MVAPPVWWTTIRSMALPPRGLWLGEAIQTGWRSTTALGVFPSVTAPFFRWAGLTAAALILPFRTVMLISRGRKIRGGTGASFAMSGPTGSSVAPARVTRNVQLLLSTLRRLSEAMPWLLVVAVTGAVLGSLP